MVHASMAGGGHNMKILQCKVGTFFADARAHARGGAGTTTTTAPTTDPALPEHTTRTGHDRDTVSARGHHGIGHMKLTHALAMGVGRGSRATRQRHGQRRRRPQPTQPTADLALPERTTRAEHVGDTAAVRGRRGIGHTRRGDTYAWEWGGGSRANQQPPLGAAKF